MPEERHLLLERALAFGMRSNVSASPPRFGEIEVLRGQAGVEVVWRRGGLSRRSIEPLTPSASTRRSRWGWAEPGTPQ